jgi:DmsE family decaheme c-type cytochrome
MSYRRVVLSLAILAIALAASAAQPDSTKTVPAKSVAAADSEYVGTDTCLGCHEDQQKRFKNTVMGKVMANPRSAAEKRGCESCHGPGKAHVEAGGGKDTVAIRFGKDSRNSIAEQNAACLDCHSRGNRMFWKGSSHETRAMACVDCHEVKRVRVDSLSAEARFRAPLSDTKSISKQQPELCLQCHQMRRGQLQRSSHMPFREGKVTCTSCHNPHGTPNPAQLIQANVNENCYSCHADRRGPFLWQHPPVAENCGTCHEAHGSTNPQLLKTRSPRLCQQCHNATPMGHGTTGWPGGIVQQSGQTVGLSNRALNRSCTNCHTKVHGTNAPSGEFLIR